MATNVLHMLDRLLAVPTTIEEQAWIVSAMFGIDINKDDYKPFLSGINSYFQDWYDQQCRDCAQNVSIRTHGDLAKVVGYLQEENATLNSVFGKIRLELYESVKTSQLEASVILALRVCCAVSIGEIEGSYPPGQILPWPGNPDAAISEQINSKFAPQSLTDEVVKLPRLFNAKNVTKIAGIQVCWTSNLADHLLMRDDESKITVFHYASILKLQSESEKNILEHDVVDETLRTIALLIPSNDPAVQKWLKSEIRSHGLDPMVGKCGHLPTRGRDIKKFKFWRDRIIILKQAFDDAEPKTISQWWNDDRRKVQWYTFWVAATVLLLTVVFGMVQSIAAVMQTWKTFRGDGNDKKPI